jgi:serine/threonine protein kinase
LYESTGEFEVEKLVNLVGVRNSLESSILDLSLFEKGREMANGSGSGSEVSVEQYCRRSDGFEVVVKSFDSFESDKLDDILIDLFMLTQFKHRCIAPLVGFVLPTDSTPLKTATLYYSCGSLEDVESSNPVWWTSTTKAKALAGIALGMKFAHEFGVAHGSLKPTNILFDEEHCVHIVDIGLRGECQDFDALEAAKKADVLSFVSIMFEMLIGCPEEEKERKENGEVTTTPECVPAFVGELLEKGLSPDLIEPSFETMIKQMKKNSFAFEKGVDICEVLKFVDSIESRYG